MPASLRQQLLASLLLAIFLSAAGCTGPIEYVRNGFKVGPDYQRPAAPVSSEWIDAANPKISSAPENPCEWWKLLNDPILDGLVRNAYAQNLDVRVAGSRILEARAIRGVAVGNLFPQTQTANLEFQRIARSSNTASGFPGVFFDDWRAYFDSSWELDFWGRLRRSVEASQADLDASVENYDNALVILTSDVATNYIQYRSFQERLRLARRNVELQGGILSIAQDRFDAGRTSELDVSQAEANLAQTRSLIPALATGLRLANNRLCVLLGIPVVDLAPQLGEQPLPKAPADVVAGVPAELLRRRPDVRRAERLVAAANARVGVAQADFYPFISLRGTLGVEAENFSNLFSPGSLFGNTGPTIRWNILNYGRVLNNVRIQDARLQNAALTYQATVLQANEEAENAIVSFLNSQQQSLELQRAVNAALRSEETVSIQYREGATDFNRVFNIQLLLLQQQDLSATTRRDVLLNLIFLYRSLGGGWQIRLMENPVPEPLPPPGAVTPPPAPPEPLPLPPEPLPPEQRRNEPPVPNDPLDPGAEQP